MGLTRLRLSLRRCRDMVAHVLAVWFGCGHVPFAPGTAGTLGAVPLYLLVRPHGLAAVALTAVLLTATGIWAAGVVERKLAVKDPQIICIDEVAGVFVTWLGAPPGWKGLWAGFVVFRILDHWKPWPARLAERRLPGGLGVMGDDLIAGAWGGGILYLVSRSGLL